jgi:hypothetical protein
MPLLGFKAQFVPAVENGLADLQGVVLEHLGRLRTLGLVDYPERGLVRAAAVLFLEGA